LARAGKGTGKNKSPGKSLSSLPWLRDHIDDRGLSVAHDLNGFAQRRAELIRLGDRAEAVQAHARAIAAKSGAGSSMRMPLPLFSTARCRQRAIRS